MASGPAGTGWSDLAANMNAMFQSGNIGNFAARFKLKHGSNGNVNGPNTTPYKFGQFVDKHGGLLSGTALGTVLDRFGETTLGGRLTRSSRIYRKAQSY